jgi:mono/diheme cytochrome c family protein
MPPLRHRLHPAAALLVLLSGPAGAGEAAVRGAAIVDEWCRLCHLRATAAPDPDMAPPFEDVVKREGRDEAYFVRFMGEDHFPMTTFRLFDDEKADVVAYLMMLQRQGATRP